MGKLSKILLLCGLLAVLPHAQAAYIQRTITIDGDMSDWTTSPDITNNTNPYQYSTDAADNAGDPDSANITSSARDLKKFSFTWDATYLYFYVETWADTNNVHWLFYIDTNADDIMGATDRVLDVVWQSNGTTNSTVYYYSPSNPAGDTLTGDGTNMPGTVGSTIITYLPSVGGAVSKQQMETRVAWADLVATGNPTNLKFHISSALGTNLPSQVQDNMNGPAGGQLFPKDLQISKSASVSSIRGQQNFTYTVSVYNAAIVDMTSVVIHDALPSQVTYVSSSADSGSYSDVTGDWTVGTVPPNTTYTLTITVTAGVLPVSTNVDNTAALTASTPADEDNSNDSATATITILPIPQLTVVKYASSPTVNPGGVVTYTLDITNTGGDDGYSVVIDDHLSPFVALKINKSGGTPFLLTDSPSNPSGLTMGTMSYSSDNGTTYTHPLTDRGDGYDNDVTNFKIQMNGTINKKVSPATGGNFTIQYDVIVK